MRRGALRPNRLQHATPALRVLFMTGYCDDSEVRGELASTGRPILQKPFGVESLSTAVRACLI